MVSFREAVANAASSALCAIIAVNDDGARVFGRVIPPLAGPSDYFNFFAPLRAQLCDDPPNYDPPQPPFQGGQCPVFYSITHTIQNAGVFCGEQPAPVTNTTNGVLGPIGPVVGRNGPTGGANLCPGFSAENQTVTDGNGNIRVLGGSAFGSQLLSISVSRQDGLPDNCGSLPIVVPPPGPVQRPINITYDNSEGDVTNINGDIVFSPAFSVGDLNVRVPFNLDLGGVTWTGNLQISPSFELTIAPNVNLGGGGSTGSDPPPPTGDPGTPPPPEDEDENQAIIGVVVRSSPTSELRQTEIATVGIPTIYAPRIASVSFAIESSFTVAWTPDTPVKNRDCFIPCPAVQGAVGVSVSPEPGWECSFVAVRGVPANAT